jgi:hypothetical protein
MIIKTLYRVERTTGGVDVTPIKPTEQSYTETYRVIADEGKVLTDGENHFICIDTDYPENYTEISETEDDYSEAGKILLGVSE